MTDNDDSHDGIDDETDEGPSHEKQWVERDGWNDTVKEGYDTIAEKYDSQRDFEPEKPLVADLDDALEPGSRILDAGCGGGYPVVAPLEDRHNVVGLDISRGQLALADERTDTAHLAEGDLSRLPFDDDSLDALTSFHAIIHVPRERHDEVFAEFARVLQPGGHLLVSVGNDDWEGENPDWMDGGAAMRWSFYGADKNRELLREAGFEIRDDTVLDDELGEGDWLYVRARLSEE
jgi:SAM-dependent methyltransferase